MCASRLALLGVTQGLIHDGRTISEDDDGHARGQQGDGAMLQFGGMIAFGVDVGDLLELQGAL
jgi:hypothetical protein